MDPQNFDDAFAEFSGAPAQNEPDEKHDDEALTQAVTTETPESDTQEQQAEDQTPLAETTAQPIDLPVEDAPLSIDDLLAFAPEDKRDRYRELVHRVKSDNGRVSALTKLYNESKARAEEAAQRLSELQAQAQEIKSGATQEQKDELAESASQLEQEFPELAKSVKLMVKQLVKQEAPVQAPRVDQVQQVQNDPVVENLSQQYAALEAAHPDWKRIASTDAFARWKEQLPPQFQRVVDSSDAQDVIWALSQYKSAVNAARQVKAAEEAEAKRKRLALHAGPRSRVPNVVSAPDDFEAAFNYYASRS